MRRSLVSMVVGVALLVGAVFSAVRVVPHAAVLGALLTSVLMAAALFLLVRALPWVAFVIFGQRDPESRPIGWVPGNGGNGSGGGQVPPLVPYDRDWDPDRRIR